MQHEWVNTDKPARYGLLRRKRGYIREGKCKRCSVRVKVKAPHKWALDYTNIIANIGLDCPAATIDIERDIEAIAGNREHLGDGHQNRD